MIQNTYITIKIKCLVSLGLSVLNASGLQSSVEISQTRFSRSIVSPSRFQQTNTVFLFVDRLHLGSEWLKSHPLGIDLGSYFTLPNPTIINHQGEKQTTDPRSVIRGNYQCLGLSTSVFVWWSIYFYQSPGFHTTVAMVTARRRRRARCWNSKGPVHE